jgi:hypothetical protein
MADDGTLTVEVVAVLEDLREDFRHYLAEGTSLAQSGEAAGTKRAARQALLSFFAFAEGSLNLILLVLGVSTRSTAPHNFFQKLQLVERATGHLAPEVLQLTRQLRNDIEHWWPGRDLAIFDQVTPAAVMQVAQAFEEWVRLLPSSCHVVLNFDSREAHEALLRKLSELGVETTPIIPDRLGTQQGRGGGPTTC